MKKGMPEMDIRFVRSRLSYVCLAVGIVILLVTHVYNTKFAYRYENVPIQYEKYEKDLELNTHVEMNIYHAAPIALKERITSEMYGGRSYTSMEGIYYYVIDEQGTEGIAFLPHFQYNRLYNPISLQADDYKFDTPLQVYGSIAENPNFEDYQELAGMKEWISEHALLSVDSFEPLNEEVRIGERISDSWIGIGILFLIAFFVLRPRKNADMA